MTERFANFNSAISAKSCVCASSAFGQAVTVFFNNFLCNENFVTYRAVLTFFKTCFCACRSFRRINHFCVTESVDNFLCNNNGITYRAMLTFCKTCFCACRSFRCINHFCVTKSCLKFFSTYCTCLSVRAVCRFAVGVSRNNYLCNENFVTYRAVLTFCKTCFCARVGNCFINNFCVAKSID